MKTDKRVPQHYIYKLNSTDIVKENCNMTLALSNVLKNSPELVIALGDSQLFRFIEDITNTHSTTQAKELSNDIKNLANKIKGMESDINVKPKQLTDAKSKLAILRQNLFRIRFEPNLIQVCFTSKPDYNRFYKNGFVVNGIKYVELFGTTGGIKNSTILYVNQDIFGELTERIDAGRNQNIEMIPAKLQAYMALTASNDIALGLKPRILVVNDVITHYTDEVLRLENVDDVDENGEQLPPTIKYIKDEAIELNACDGCSVMTPEFATKINNVLNNIDDEPISGVCVRGLPFVKGMLFPFDFVEFAEKVAHTYEVTDFYGIKRDIRDYDIILTESMFKLANAYSSTEEYMSYVEKYNYNFSVSKTAPLHNDVIRTTNYQFLQSYELSDEDIAELVKPTLDNIKDIMGMNPYKSILYMMGTHLSENLSLDDLTNNNEFYSNYYLQALMIAPEIMINDTCVRNKIYKNIKERINSAKLGVLDIHSHFSIVGGDLYGLCQNIFGLEVTGLLKANEVYNYTWHSQNTKEIMCFRAPMSVHNNIRKLNISYNEDANYWFRYIKTCTLVNSWDTTCQALDGMDFDADLMFESDNSVLIRNFRPLPVIECIQKKSSKKIVERKDMHKATYKVLGKNDIGTITNRITAMTSLMAQYDKESAEYKELLYRTQTGIAYQQDSIDAIKGIETSTMPKSWYDNHKNKIKDEDDLETIEHKDFNRSICVDKKPFFFIWNYKTLLKQYNDLIDEANGQCKMRYGYTYEDLLRLPKEDLDENQLALISHINYEMPVFEAPCTMNRICRYVMKNTEGLKEEKAHFDYKFLMAKANRGTNLISSLKKKIKPIITDYQDNVIKAKQKSQTQYTTSFTEASNTVNFNAVMFEYYKNEFRKIHKDYNAILDVLIIMAYEDKIGQTLLWNCFGEDLVQRIIVKYGNKITYPIPTTEQDAPIQYAGYNYKLYTKEIK